MTFRRFVVGFSLACAVAFGVRECQAAGDDWTPANKILFGTLVGLQAIDVAQTNYARTHQDKFREINPIYGNPPNMLAVVGLKAAMLYGAYYISQDMSATQRNLLFGALSVIQLSVDAHNASIGVKIGF